LSAVNWLVSQPWPVFLAIWIPSLLVFGGVLLALFARPPRKPAVDEHAAQAIATREPPRLRSWHKHPCGCWCGSDGRKRPCPKHALVEQEIRDLLAWERERHQP
jgi:hypothetical protein